MSFWKKLLNPVSLVTKSKSANVLLDPAGSVLGADSIKEAAKSPVARLALPGTSLLVRDPYKFLDYSAYGAGDFYSPTKTDPNNKGWDSVLEGLKNYGKGTGGNKIYDVAGPIAALVTGGYFASGALGGGGGAAAGGEGGSGAAAAGSAGEGGTSSLAGGASAGGSGMSWTDFLPLVGDVISGGASLWSADKAADTSEKAAQISSDTMLKMFYQNREDLAPWRDTGKEAVNTLWQKVQAGPGEYTESPGYKFRLSEGEKAINRAAASRGGFDSGKTLKALTKYGQDYATADYDNFLQRWYQSLNPYASLANVGQIATTDTAKMGTDVAKDVAANTLYAGNTRASSYLNSANIFDQALDSGINNYLMARYLQKN